MRRYPLIIMVVASLLAGCAIPPQVGLLVEDDPAPAAVPEPVVTTPTPPPLVGVWFVYPDLPDDAMCSSLFLDDPIPCNDVLAVCGVPVDGVPAGPLFMLGTIGCTLDSPTFDDVCRTVDPVQWGWYGLREYCEAGS